MQGPNELARSTMLSAAFVLHDSFLESAYLLPKDVIRKVLKAFNLFRHNPRHPSLNFESLHGASNSLKSIRVDDNYRTILREGNIALELLYVGPDDRAYRFAENFGGVRVQPTEQEWNALSLTAPRNPLQTQLRWSYVQGLLRTRKYLPVTRLLLSQVDNSVEFTFSQFESLLGGPLPRSAGLYRAWWANFAGHVQASAWLAVGWNVSSVDFAGKKVAFTRDIDSFERIRAALRTAQADLANVFCFDDVTVNFLSAEVVRSGRSVGLKRKEFMTLQFMIRNAGRIILRNELLNEVWGYHDCPFTRTVDTHICQLRHKLERDPSHPIHFRTVPRVGYKFVP